ncbi:MAG: metallophosphoesterase [Verrucomicrobiales bacterium]|nr:metallophosphoesterase [Verrucomicrobiales bacterium]
MIEFIHISDTHFGPSKDLEIRGSNPYERNCALVEAINSLGFTPDFFVHTGDIVNDPDDDAYELAESVLSRLDAPVHYVSGNHDDAAATRKFMTSGSHVQLKGVGDKLAYAFRMGPRATGVVFDGWVAPDQGPHGFLSQSQVIAFEDLLQTTDDRFALFLHYPMIPIGSTWIDKHLLVENGEAVHSFLKEYRDRIAGVFFGHLHRGLQLHRDGILYSGVSSPVCHFTAGPVEETCEFSPNCGLAFNHVSISDHSTMVKEYSIPFVQG